METKPADEQITLLTNTSSVAFMRSEIKDLIIRSMEIQIILRDREIRYPRTSGAVRQLVNLGLI
jgi:hypothetical protein